MVPRRFKTSQRRFVLGFLVGSGGVWVYVCGNVYDCGGMVGAALYAAKKRKDQRESKQHAESQEELLNR
jgi:hypothetical protein